MPQLKQKQFPGPVADAVRVAGGWEALAKLLNVQRQAIYQWTRIPAGRVLKVEKVTGIPRHKLRPDLYPEPAAERVA